MQNKLIGFRLRFEAITQIMTGCQFHLMTPRRTLARISPEGADVFAERMIEAGEDLRLFAMGREPESLVTPTQVEPTPATKENQHGE